MEEIQKVKKTKRSENETYKSLLANVNKINRKINNLTNKKSKIRNLLAKYYKCEKCLKFFNKTLKKNITKTGRIITDTERHWNNFGDLIEEYKTDTYVKELKCPYCSYIQENEYGFKNYLRAYDFKYYY